MGDGLLREAAVRNDLGQFAAQETALGIDHRLVTLEPQLPGHAHAGRTAADDGDALAAGGSGLGRSRRKAGLAQHGNINGLQALVLTGAVGHAQVGAEIAADRRGQRGVAQDQVDGLLAEALAHQLPALLHRDAGRTGILAGRQILLIRPGRHEAPHLAADDDLDLRTIQLGQVADHAALTEFGVPDLPVEGPDAATLLGELFVGLARHEQLPVGAVAQGREQFGAPDGRQIILEASHEPGPVGVADLAQPRIGLAETLVRAAEEDPAADHADAGSIAQDVAVVALVQAADHGRAASHELGEAVAHAAQHPEFGRGVLGILLGHGHAAGADVAADVNLALGHAIAGAVGGVAVHDDGGAGVQPAHVVTDRTHHLDRGVLEALRTDTLTGRTLDDDRDRLAVFHSLDGDFLN
ncbi:MAG: hypothetical protein BWY87_00740 [Deltaproteobacteria bacterium ADurb.Bin510]|nr:MAG: hypothetical protein BWY87_00740 [Deltaproteobacteria bacterium ADurb.Bin510]